MTPLRRVETALDRIAALDPELHAFIDVDPEGARSAAQALDTAPREGLLHGVPVGVKDVFDIASQQTLANARHRQGHVATADSTAVERLRRAGAVIVGKTVTPELALGPFWDDLPFPMAVNPRAPDRWAGASSSGSAVAVASGMVPLALGSDTAGSVRLPAACCGCLGLKLTTGLVPTEGVVPFSPSLDTVGLLAARAADLAAAVAALAPGLGEPRHVARVGLVRGLGAPSDPRVQVAVEDAAERFGQVREVELPPLARFQEPNLAIALAEANRLYGARIAAEPERFGRFFRDTVGPAALSAAQLEAAFAESIRLRAVIDAALVEVDVLIMPTLDGPPPLLSDLATLPLDRLRLFTTPASLCGHPAIAIPWGATEDGLPLSVQLVARRHDDATLVAAAAMLEP